MRQSLKKEKRLEARQKKTDEKEKSSLKTGAGYNWGLMAFVEAPFAISLGSLNALVEIPLLLIALDIH